MSKVTMRWDVINHYMPKDGSGRFLEIGTANGECARHVNGKWKVGVDPEPLHTGMYHRHWKVTSNEYFSRGLCHVEQRFNVVFIDGLHHAEQVLDDLLGALSIGPDVVLLHDCNPVKEIHQRVPRETVHWNGDCWKVIAALRMAGFTGVFTYDCDEGIGAIVKHTWESVRVRRDLVLSTIRHLDYSVLEGARRDVLSLQPWGWEHE